MIIHAKFVGIRYFMYYYPITSAIVGTTLNFNVLALVVLLSWLRFFAPSNYREDPEEDDEVSDDLDGPIKPRRSSITAGKEIEKDGTESRRSSDLEVLNSDIVFQLDPEEDIKNTTQAKKNL